MRKNYSDDTAFLDLLLNCLVGFVFLFMVAFIQIDPEEKNVADIKTKAEYVITLTWPLEDSSDVDIWIQDPAGNLISFKQKEFGLTHIDRDDLGHANDTFTMPDGRVIKYDYNQEIVTIRGIIPGDWTINIHYYKKGSNTPNTPATVRIDKINPKVQTVFNETIVLKKHFEERTVIRFTMKTNGDMIGVHHRFLSLLKQHPEMKNRVASGGGVSSPGGVGTE